MLMGLLPVGTGEIVKMQASDVKAKPVTFKFRRILVEARRERLAREIAEKMTPELKQENRIQNA
jgi:hypothetical protein